MLVLIKRLGTRMLKRNPKSTGRRKQRSDPLLSGRAQPNPRLNSAPGHPDPNARFLGEQTGEGGGST
jgi:hypothetical protein